MLKDLALKVMFFIIILLQSKLASLGQCDNRLEPAQSATVAYQFRGNRCEGAYSAQVGAPSLEIAGFTIGALSYSLERSEIIKIKNFTNFPVSIRSSALSIGTYYRMDASLEADDTLKWAVNDVLFNLEIPAKSLGVYGWFGSEQEKTYLPVRAVSSKSNSDDKKLYLIIRPNTSVIQARYRYAVEGQALGDYVTAKLSNNRESISIVLPDSLIGVYTIEIAAMLESGAGWVVKQYKFRSNEE